MQEKEAKSWNPLNHFYVVESSGSTKGIIGKYAEVQTDTSRVIWNEDDSKRGVNKAKAQAALRAARQGPEQTKPNQSAEILPTSPVFHQPLLSPAHRNCDATRPSSIDSTIWNFQSSPAQQAKFLFSL